MGDELRLAGAVGAALALALLAVPPAIAAARRWDLVDHPVGWKAHARGTPYLGGAAVWLALLGATLALSPDLGRFLPLLAASGVCLAIGTLDDKLGLSAPLRVLAVAVLAAALDTAGLGWEAFSSGPANLLLTVVWCLGVVNAINLLDLMDGTAASAAGVGAAATAVLAATFGDYADAVLAAALAGACLGFLRYNLRAPASIFLGDGGSMSIGLVLATAVMALPFPAGFGLAGVALGVLLVGVPTWDMAFRIFSRLRHGIPLGRPGPDSIANWLAARLSSPRRVAGVLALGQAALGAVAILAAHRSAALAAVAAVATLVLGGLLMLPLRGWRPGSPKPRKPAAFQLISRLNVGGAAVQAINLAHSLEPHYDATLLSGTEGEREGGMNGLADALGVRRRHVPGLRREIGPRDLRALAFIRRQIRRERPSVLHTHAAKGGTLGRLAAVLSGRRRPDAIVHTFHGHVLSDYFSPRRSRLFVAIERAMARITTRLVAVGEDVKRDLVRFGIAREDEIEVIPVGLDLSPFDLGEAARAEARARSRAELGIADHELVVSFVGRLVPIKRVDRFLRIAALLADVPGVRFLVLGDGPLREELAGSPEAEALGDRVVWAGFRDEVAPLYFASDVVALTSDSEGTPTSLVEAQAAGVPVVCTDVGGTRETVLDGKTGLVLPAEEEHRFAAALRELLADRELRRRLGAEGRLHANERFRLERMVAEVMGLYERLLRER